MHEPTNDATHPWHVVIDTQKGLRFYSGAASKSDAGELAAHCMETPGAFPYRAVLAGKHFKAVGTKDKHVIVAVDES